MEKSKIIKNKDFKIIIREPHRTIYIFTSVMGMWDAKI